MHISASPPTILFTILITGATAVLTDIIIVRLTFASLAYVDSMAINLYKV